MTEGHPDNIHRDATIKVIAWMIRKGVEVWVPVYGSSNGAFWVLTGGKQRRVEVYVSSSKFTGASDVGGDLPICPRGDWDGCSPKPNRIVVVNADLTHFAAFEPWDGWVSPDGDADEMLTVPHDSKRLKFYGFETKGVSEHGVSDDK